MQIPAQLVKRIARADQRGISDCLRGARGKAGGDIEKAISVLRKKARRAAAKKRRREASEGSWAATFTRRQDWRARGAELRSDFVAARCVPSSSSHDIACTVAALDPRYVRREEVRRRLLEKRREIYVRRHWHGKPEAVVREIVERKMEKFYEENCLYETALH